ncbi:MAG: type II secretion system protein [bacterium]|nr:type II secretion system protein [bacterium]
MMEKQIKKGFTIIETTLVLAISGLLAVSLLVGWSRNIITQRYNDSVETFKSDIQSVFGEVENQSNPRNNKIRCTVDNNGGIVNTHVEISDNGNTRGTTNCIVLGKIMSFGDDGTANSGHINATVRDVIGLDININTACHGQCSSNIDALRATKFVISAGKNRVSDPRNIGLEWGSQFKNATDNRPSTGPLFRPDTEAEGTTLRMNTPYGNGQVNDVRETVDNVMIVRSPIDGSIMTFGIPMQPITDNNRLVNNPEGMRTFRLWSTSSGFLMSSNKTVNICVRSAGGNGFFSANAIFGKNKVIKIGSGSSSVEVAPLDGARGSSCGDSPGFRDVVINGVRLQE